MKKLTKLGVVEKEVTLPNGNVINYGELPGEGPALLLIHGQMGSWEDYASVMPELHENWHIYAIENLRMKKNCTTWTQMEMILSGLLRM